MRAKAIHRWNVLDKHTGEIRGAFSTERGAKNAAVRLCEEFKSPGRYYAKQRA
jgi:hypothetical protein